MKTLTAAALAAWVGLLARGAAAQSYGCDTAPYGSAQPCAGYRAYGGGPGPADESDQDDEEPQGRDLGPVDAAELDDGYDPAAYQYFEASLAPYGRWYDTAEYGRVWVPSTSYVGLDFTPYTTGGRWVFTDYGWTWVSDWEWGRAPFHYGRWVQTPALGWAWVPGTVWGPAWVTWRAAGPYVGWAPLPPRGVPARARAAPAWNFVPAAQLGARRLPLAPAQVVPTLVQQSRPADSARTVSVAGVPVRINPGPAQIAATPAAPTPLRQVAPRALPQPQIVPRPGVPLGVRPWAPGGRVPPPPRGPAPEIPPPPQRFNPASRPAVPLPPSHSTPGPRPGG